MVATAAVVVIVLGGGLFKVEVFRMGLGRLSIPELAASSEIG